MIRVAGVGLVSTVLHLGLFTITWAATSAALWLLAALAPGTGAVGQTVVVAMANAVSTVVRVVAMRSWIFRSDPAPR